MTEDNLRLITRIISKEASATEIRSFQKWIKSSAENKAIFDDLLAVWNKSGNYRSDIDVEQGLHVLRRKISYSSPVMTHPFPKKKIGRTYKQRLILRIAASLILISLVAGAFYLKSSKSEIQYKTLSMPYGKKGSLHLSDGSTLEVNSGTKITFPKQFSDDERVVKIDGEAFFDIEKDKDRPFIIEAGELEIRVLGTSFNLRSYKNDKTVELGVKTGSVSVTNKRKDNSRPSNIFYLEPGELMSFNVSENTFEKKKADIDILSSWTKETLTFDDRNLGEVAAMLQRWYNIPIVLENKALMDCVFMGEYKKESLANILEALKFSVGIEYKLLKNKVVISGTGCTTKQKTHEQLKPKETGKSNNVPLS